MEISFKGKTALVTGSTRGIGKRIADDIEDSGGKVLRTGTNNLDFTDEKSISEYKVYLAGFGKIDILVNNAGVNKLGAIGNLDKNAVDKIMKINLEGAMIMTNAIVPLMIENRYGRIINISSILGIVSLPKRSVYSMAKAGLIGFTRGCALDLAKYNILVNSVSPGFIETDLTHKMLGRAGVAGKKKQIPIGRIGNPYDVSTVVCFLCSDLNNYITGENVVVDGGYIIH